MLLEAFILQFINHFIDIHVLQVRSICFVLVVCMFALSIFPACNLYVLSISACICCAMHHNYSECNIVLTMYNLQSITAKYITCFHSMSSNIVLELLCGFIAYDIVFSIADYLSKASP